MPAAAANATPAVWLKEANPAVTAASDGSSSRATSAANEEDTLLGEPQMQAGPPGRWCSRPLHMWECQPVAVGGCSAYPCTAQGRDTFRHAERMSCAMAKSASAPSETQLLRLPLSFRYQPSQ